jgi:hypothetical protein
VLRTEFAPDNGAYVDAVVYFPTVELYRRIPLLIDTGAIVTAIAQDDIARITPEDVSDIPLRRSDRDLVGVGGRIEWWEFDGAVILTHQDGGLTFVAQPIAVLPTGGITSVLGRDILSHGILNLDGPQRAVTFDIAQGFIR